MQFIDLAAQQARIKGAIDANIQRVLAHGQYIKGPEVSELEEKLAAFTGAKHCIGVANGTDALQIALMAASRSPCDCARPSFPRHHFSRTRSSSPESLQATSELSLLRSAIPR